MAGVSSTMTRPLFVSMTSTFCGSGVRQSASVGAAGVAGATAFGPAFALAAQTAVIAAARSREKFMAPRL